MEAALPLPFMPQGTEGREREGGEAVSAAEDLLRFEGKGAVGEVDEKVAVKSDAY